MSLEKSHHWLEKIILSSDGVYKIRVGMWLPKKGDPDHWLVFVNGRTEFIEKYEHVPHEISLRPTQAFLTWDHCGQGQSSGARSSIDSYSDFSGVMTDVMKKYVKASPYFILAHSMGGLISLRTVLKGECPPPAKMILCSPLLRLRGEPAKLKVFRKLSEKLVRLGLGQTRYSAGPFKVKMQFPGNAYTQDYDMWKIIAKPPYSCPSATYAWIRASFEATDLVANPEFLKNLPCPVLIMAGTNERIVGPTGFSKWALKASEFNSVEFELIQKGRHELMMELPSIRERVYKRVWEFTSDFYEDLNESKTA